MPFPVSLREKGTEMKIFATKKRIAAVIIVALIILGALPFLIMYSGIYSVSMLNQDNALVNWMLDTGMTRSVQHHAKGIQAPDLSAAAKIQMGFSHFNQMCVACHGAPGAPPDEISAGIWPRAPYLPDTVSDWTPGELFWLTKNGIKFTAMPAWGPSHSDEQIWAIVAFLERLPKTTDAEYEAMVKKDKGKPMPEDPAN